MTLDDQGIPTAPLGSRYRLDRRIGSGGMAEVFAGTDLVLERTVAVKRLSRALVGDAVAHRRFQREARALASTHDPNVVAVFDVGEDEDGPYLVMELVEGTTLRAVLDREGRLEPARALAIATAIAQGLAAVHAHGVVHRDVKPSNVFLTGDDQVKIGDFGIARIAEGAPVTRSGEVLGSAPYVAPEQVTGRNVGPPADLYGLGCIVFEMLAGRPPFEGDDPLALAYSHVHEDPPRLDAITQGIPTPVAGLVDRLLAKDPQDRPASAGDARRLLVETAAGLSGRPPDEAMTAPLETPPHGGVPRTERLERHPTTPLPPPAPGFTAPLPPPILVPTAPPSSPVADGEPLRLKPWLLWGAGGVALLLVFVLLAGLFRTDRQAGVQDRASARSPTTSPSASASLTPATAGAVLVDLANRLAAEGTIGQDVASAVQHTVDEVLTASGGGKGDEDKTVEKLDGLREKINEALDKGRITSADAAHRLNQGIDNLVKALGPTGD